MILPTVSIGVPVYNGERYLEGCLRNLLAQTFRDFELIVSDNASGDGTREICQRIAASDPRVRYHREESNRGASWNYNRLVELARGKYFKWAAYDDLISPDFIETCLKSLRADPGQIIGYGTTVIIDGDGVEKEVRPDRMTISAERPSARLREYLYKVGMTNAIYGLMPLEILRRTPGLEAYPGSDVVLLGELAMLGRFREIGEIKFYRRIHPQASAAANPSLNQLAAWFNPTHSGRLVLPNWEHFRGYVAAIRRLPCPGGEKWRCLLVFLGWRRYGGGALLGEALQKAVSLLRAGKHVALLAALPAWYNAGAGLTVLAPAWT